MARTQEEMKAIIEKALALKAKREEEKRELQAIFEETLTAAQKRDFRLLSAGEDWARKHDKYNDWLAAVETESSYPPSLMDKWCDFYSKHAKYIGYQG